MRSREVQELSYEFALLVFELYDHLTQVEKEYILSKQLLRSGTSVGAMIREAQNAESKADFIHKLSIAQKECDESKCWLELLNKRRNIENFDQLYALASSILRLLRTIILNTKAQLKTKSPR